MDDLSFLLTTPPSPLSDGGAAEIPFPVGSFARECVEGWMNQADQIDAGKLHFPGNLGLLISRTNRESVRQALADPDAFIQLSERASAD